MAKFSGKNIEFKDGQKAIFGTDDDSAIYWDNSADHLVFTTVVSGVDPTAPGHLTPRFYVDNAVATISGIAQGEKGDTGFGVFASGRIASNGSNLDTVNLSVSRTATGTYSCTFDTAASDANYSIHVQPYQTVTDTNAMVSNVTSTGFTVTIGQGDNGNTPDVLTDTNFSVLVIHSKGTPASALDISFLDLNDTPSAYSGSVGDYVRVTASGLEFAEVNLVVDHGELTGLEDDDHIQYILTDGTRGFTSTVSGVAPSQPEHLATKEYIDNELATVSGGIVQDHGGLTGLGDDDHTQYILADGTRALTGNWDAGDYSITATEFYGDGSTLSGIPYVDGDDVYFYDSTRDKDLGVAILEIGCGRNSANTTDQYLRTYNGTPMNQAGVALPWDATLIGGAGTGARNDQTWTIRLRKNDSATNISSLTVTNAYENHVTNADIDFDEGDRIQIYMEGTNINYPQARLYFRRRK
jgi:hypothetical protein